MASSPEEPDQDALFTVEIKGNGSTDPGSFAIDYRFAMPEDGSRAGPPQEELTVQEMLS